MAATVVNLAASRTSIPDWRMIIAGGSQVISNSVMLSNDVWVSTGSGAVGSSWSQIISRAPWDARYDHGLMNIPQFGAPTQLLVLTGGMALENQVYSTLNDIWISSNMGFTWSTMQPAFPARSNFASVVASSPFVSSNTDLAPPCGIVLGGALSSTSVSNDVWALCNGQWSSAGTASWSPRSGHSAVAYNGGANVAVLGGLTTNNKPNNDVWMWTLNGNTWTLITAAGNFAALTRGHLVASQGPPLSYQVFSLLDGDTSGSGIPANSVWVCTNLTDWTSTYPVANPVRVKAGATVMPTRNLGMYVGGYVFPSNYDDVWSGPLFT